jgi:hypothetical protein
MERRMPFSSLPCRARDEARQEDRDFGPVHMKPSHYKVFDSALDAMIRKHLPQISPAKKEEVHAQCWVAILNAMKKWEKERGEVNSWIYSTMLYTLKDIRKGIVHRSKGPTFIHIDPPGLENGTKDVTPSQRRG